MKLRLDSRIRALALAAIALLVAGLVPAHGRNHGREHDAVRQAVERGEIRSLTDILNSVRDKLPGEVVGVEIEQQDGRWLYEFRAVDAKGRLFEVHVDAHSGAIERIREK